jgi:hypothetical protein
MSHPVIRCCCRAARLLSAGAPQRLGFLDRGEQLGGLGVRFTQEPPPWAR